ncbi:MAG: hypothetical protein Q4P06_02275 [Actinomycetaceae bacterium]|nr:hypothetical protein [Actinomycetaceae bacterium]
MKVLHINDVARIGTLLVRQAHQEGLDWQLYDIARTDPNWSARTRLLRKAARGLVWEAGLARRAATADLLNVHGGNVPRHTSWVPKPYVLHLHGSDVRTVRLQPEQGKIIDRAIARAKQVYYTTPDLAEHAVPLRPDAQLQPIVVDVDAVPFSEDVPQVTKVIFPSRWGPEKGGELQIEVAVALRRALGADVRLEGLDWGSNAARAAREAQVTLLPKMGYAQYLQWLSTATVSIGQNTGIMGVSELEAIATGVPLVMPLNPRWYDGSHPTMVDIPVQVGIADPDTWVDAIVETTRHVLANPQRVDYRQWLDQMHGPRVAVQRLQSSYRKLEGA